MPEPELEAVQALRLKLRAARNLIRDLNIACARAEEALEDARRHRPIAQPKEAQRDDYDREHEQDARCVA